MRMVQAYRLLYGRRADTTTVVNVHYYRKANPFRFDQQSTAGWPRMKFEVVKDNRKLTEQWRDLNDNVPIQDHDALTPVCVFINLLVGLPGKW